jgi:Eukaryotic aspartyl protease
MDTGSNKLIMLDPSTYEASSRCAAPNRFDSSTSSTFVDTGISDSISYLDGSYIIGNMVRDTVSFDNSASIQATSFKFLLASQQNGFECDDGLIGMVRYVTGYGYPQFIDQLYQQSKISSRMFSIYMTTYGTQSSMQIGGYDTSYLGSGYTDHIWVPLTDYYMFWVTEVNAYRIGTSDTAADGTVMGYTMSSPQYAIMDTGTSLMLIP